MRVFRRQRTPRSTVITFRKELAESEIIGKVSAGVCDSRMAGDRRELVRQRTGDSRLSEDAAGTVVKDEDLNVKDAK